MRMTALVGKLDAAPTRFLRGAGHCRRSRLLPAHRHRPALEYAYEESFIVTPALELSGSWRASAFPVGIVLMIGIRPLAARHEQPP